MNTDFFPHPRVLVALNSYYLRVGQIELNYFHVEISSQ